jgi:hypothetical protein
MLLSRRHQSVGVLTYNMKKVYLNTWKYLKIIFIILNKNTIITFIQFTREGEEQSITVLGHQKQK